jgi:hypothetical protein
MISIFTRGPITPSSICRSGPTAGCLMTSSSAAAAASAAPAAPAQ